MYALLGANILEKQCEMRMAAFSSAEAAKIPISTYRIQLSKSFRFDQATKITGYLKRLGISDCYSSPILKARAGSTHGYDVIDHSQINPEIGTLKEFEEWIAEIRSCGLGLLLDIVPNHMAMAGENLLFKDVLEFGPFSKYSGFFDIDWNRRLPRNPHNKLVLPILSVESAKAIETEAISTNYSGGEFSLSVYSTKLPLAPGSYARILLGARKKLITNSQVGAEAVRELNRTIRSLSKLPDSCSSVRRWCIPDLHAAASVQKGRLERLCAKFPQVERSIHQVLTEFNKKTEGRYLNEFQKLLRQQFYELAYWKSDVDRINYRRFSTVNDLIAICVEKPFVFWEAHRLVLELIARGKVTGLRIDHIDGLLEPSEYLLRLQKCSQRVLLLANETIKVEGSVTPSVSLSHYRLPLFVVVEKILDQGGEVLPKRWKAHGTTGYDFLCDANGIFIESKNAVEFDRILSNFTSKELSFKDITYTCRKHTIVSSMKSELANLGELLRDILRKLDRNHRPDIEDITAVIEEVAACFPVYRSYTTNKSRRVSDSDRREMELALAAARHRLDKSSGALRNTLDQIRRILLLDFPRHLTHIEKTKWRLFVLRFQQFTPPIAAKGVEDTAFYIYNRLISLNEVGANPEIFGISIEEFHKRNLLRSLKYPHSLLATSTHDTKRSEDVRARINVLSEIPERWNENLYSWSNLNKDKKSIVNGRLSPSREDEYVFYQTLLGTWPLEKMRSAKENKEFTQRISLFMKKAAREAKVETSWIEPNQSYEEALENFVRSILGSVSEDRNGFISNFQDLVRDVSYYGMLNSISQLLLKLTCPGVPDIYQGNETWDFSLVDPDNRRQVDFGVRSNMLISLERRIEDSNGNLLNLVQDLMRNMDNGLIKMYVLHQALKFRRAHERLFSDGIYLPVKAQGMRRQHIFSFQREMNGESCLVVAPRLFASLLGGKKYPEAWSVWGDTGLVLPPSMATEKFHSIFTGREVTSTSQSSGAVLKVSDVLDEFPVALLSHRFG